MPCLPILPALANLRVEKRKDVKSMGGEFSVSQTVLHFKFPMSVEVSF
jgi:hypothetical protein